MKNIARLKLRDAIEDYKVYRKDFVVLECNKLSFLEGEIAKDVIKFTNNLQGFSRHALTFDVTIEYINEETHPEHFI